MMRLLAALDRRDALFAVAAVVYGAGVVQLPAAWALTVTGAVLLLLWAVAGGGVRGPVNHGPS